MQYTDNEAALIGGLISTYFFQPAVSASLKDAYSRVLEHLHQNALTSSDLQQIRKAVNFLMPMCQSNRQTQRELMGVNARTTVLLNISRQLWITQKARRLVVPLLYAFRWLLNSAGAAVWCSSSCRTSQ